MFRLCGFAVEALTLWFGLIPLFRGIDNLARSHVRTRDITEAKFRCHAARTPPPPCAMLLRVETLWSLHRNDEELQQS